jgi:aspartyl-tRNA(Asn)/glutamyl-tRNA(Gln) amidotransferase subunit B
VTGGVGSTEPLGSGGAGFAGAGAGNWEPVIGLEIHVQLKTRTKMFCACEVAYFDRPNSHTCPVCLSHPGALPVANEKAIEYTVKLGLALGCEIAPRALFHRKNYFYPDLPKGYQISQYDVPLCGKGVFVVPEPDGVRVVGITRAHLEEDAAKNVHVGGSGGRIGGAAHTNVDFNRGGTPLVEIVTEPDLRSADEAKRFLQLLRQTIVELGISDAEMEKGTLRVDGNVSVRERGETGYRTRTELKNMNSFNFIARGIEAEIGRQIQVWESGGEVVQQTYDFDAGTGKLTPRRAKEEADDYRYFPEPDLVPVEPTAEMIERLRTELPELPAARIRRIGERLDHERALVLVTGGLERLWEATVAAGADGIAASNVIANQLVGAGVDPGAVDAGELATLVGARERIPRKAFDEAISRLAEPGFAADPYLAQEVVSDSASLEPIVDAILAANPAQVEQYRSGKDGLLGFFVGQVMKETKGQADARAVNELVRAKLGA